MDKTVLMLSNGEAHVIADFDARAAEYALGQLGVTTNNCLFLSSMEMTLFASLMK